MSSRLSIMAKAAIKVQADLKKANRTINEIERIATTSATSQILDKLVLEVINKYRKKEKVK